MSSKVKTEVLGQRQRRTEMEKKKIAESIIIRVGGGIREISREPIETQDVMELTHIESDFKLSEDTLTFRSEPGSASTESKDKTIN